MTTLELAYLTQLPFLTRPRMRLLNKRCTCIEELNKNIAQELKLTDEQFVILNELKLRWSASVFRQFLEQRSIECISRYDKEYPFLLKHIPDPPELLFAQGNIDLLKEECVSIVGTRKPSTYGKKALQYVFDTLPSICVVSGGAFGIDTMAHEMAYEKRMPRIVILGMGIVKRPERLQKTKVFRDYQYSLFLSEYWLNRSAEKYTFPERNRIISGLSKASIIVEGPRKSGSLITAAHANEQGRDVIAVPGPVYNPRSAGCHFLLESGAHVYSRELLQSIYVKTHSPSNAERQLMMQLKTPKYRDELVGESIDSTLSNLELHGVIEKTIDGRYRKT